MALHLNIGPFLAPIPGPNPSGENLRYTEVYDQINEAKREDDQLDRGEWQTELKRSNWAQVIKICTESLTRKTKDLQIAAWLTEGLLHQHGFSGLRFGLELVSKLLSDYWETLYPEIEDDDLDFRVGPLTYLNEKLPDVIYQVPLCDPDRTKGYDYFAWEESRLVGFESGLDQEQKNRRKELIEEGRLTAEEFKLATNMGSIGFYKDLYDQLVECQNKLETLDNIVTRQFVDDAPGFTRLNDTVKACLRVVEKIYSEKKKSEVADVEDVGRSENIQDEGFGQNDLNMEISDTGDLFSKANAITDISNEERNLWRSVVGQAGNGHLKSALDKLMTAAALAPSERQKNRYLLLVAKLCINAGRHDLAMPIVEQLYQLIETLNLEQWEHPVWIADVIEALYRCLEDRNDGPTERATQLFQKLCTLNITKAATFRVKSV